MSTLKVNTIQPFTSGAVLLNDNIEASGSLTPTTTNLYNLGSSTRQWRDLHVSGTANIDLAQIDSVSGSLIPREDDTLDLGSSTKQWKDLYVDGTAYVDALGPDLTIGNGVSVPSISSSIQISGSIIPHGDDTYDLGSSAKQWKDLYVDGTAYIDSASVDSGSFTGELNVTGPRVNFNNLPTIDPSVSGRLFTQSGSQLPFSGSTAELNAISSSKFVLIS